MANTTLAPSGLTITRDGLSFACAWKITSTDHGGGQQFQWKTNIDTAWRSVAVLKSATSQTVTVSAANFYPTTKKILKTVSFRVRGKRADTTTGNKTTSYEWSAWKRKDFAVYAPAVPSLKAELDSQLDDVTTFSWKADVKSNDHKPFTRVEYQNVLVKACNQSDGSKLPWSSYSKASSWSSGTGNATGSVIKDERPLPAGNSYTRWMRVRSVGVGGSSAWRYARHVYATPNKSSVASAKVESISGGVTTVKMAWVTQTNAARPIDRVVAQHYIGTPNTGLACPDGASWDAGATARDPSGSARFAVDGIAGEDECLWVRVEATHDRRVSYSNPKLAKAGTLKPPSDLSVTSNGETGRATVAATNNSAVPDSLLAVVFQKGGRRYVCGIFENGESSINVSCAPWSSSDKVAFGVYAFQGTYSSSARGDGKTQYAVTANMKSSTVWNTADVPIAPSKVVCTMQPAGDVLVEWRWSWPQADRAEVSWSENPYAWESTEPPETYFVDSINRAKIRVPGLAMGKTWYFRVRLAEETDGGTSYGPYSDIVEVDLSSIPAKPVLALSEAVIAPGRSVAAAWSYENADGTEQGFAEIWKGVESGNTVTWSGSVISTDTAKSVTLPADLGEPGDTVFLRVRVSSESGRASEWSDAVPLSIAELPVCSIDSTNLSQESEEYFLTAMPLTVTVTGAGEGGVTSLAIERAESYQMDRPDESVFQGFEGETVAAVTQTGEAAISISQDDLIGLLDDGAAYRIVATVQDGFGQFAAASLDFKVRWAHQAVMPAATVRMDPERLAAIITPTCDTEPVSGDVCDIYRLSADRPELIVSGGTWNEEYVDPYPAIGEFGGHRVVYRTVNGDYITAENHPAWIDLGAEGGDLLELREAIIDFGGDQVRLAFNLDISSSWAKDFQETQYLGGAVRGDWNPAVSRTGSIGTVAVALTDQETIRAMRRLADYAGVCHVRTPEGSSFAADVQVSESWDNARGGKVATFAMKITRVDPEGMDGLTYDEWAPEEES